MHSEFQIYVLPSNNSTSVVNFKHFNYCSKSKEDLCEHGHHIPSKRHTHHSADSQKKYPYEGNLQKRTPEIAAATVNLWTPVSTTSSSSLGAVAWRRRTLQEEDRGNQDTVSGGLCFLMIWRMVYKGIRHQQAFLACSYSAFLKRF